MPKSKREKPVYLTSVEKKNRADKNKLFDKIREACDNYPYIYVFGIENMRTNYLQDIRKDLGEDSRIFFGKTKVMAKALGQTTPEEYQPGLAKLSKFLEGNVGLLFSKRSPEELEKDLDGFSKMDYARAGVKATQDFVVPAGVVHSTGGQQPDEDDVPLAHSDEIHVRKCGMPTKLEKGKVVLGSEYVVCKEGQVLSSNQTTLLKKFGVMMSEFRVQLKAYWSSADQEVTTVKSDNAMEE